MNFSKVFKPSSQLHFSNEILGLRGLAVLLVVLSHYPLAIFKNGYIGVDVFFVISGFLITRQLIKEYLRNRGDKSKIGSISLWNFFIRRFARIFPTLLFCLILINFVVFFSTNSIMFDKTLGESVKAILFYLNVHFIQSSTMYFDSTSQSSVILPLWSLSVEEQFYFVWPLIFLSVISFHGLKFLEIRVTWLFRLFSVTAILTLLSFCLAIFTYRQNPGASYFSTGSRIWEFGFGALAAIYSEIARKYLIPNIERSVEIGLGLIAIAFFLQSERYLFLSLLPVVIGSALILMGSSGSVLPFSKAVLCNKSLLRLGLIAFPLYLLHYPIIKVGELIGIKQTIFTVSCVFALSIFLASIVHHLVELPFQGLLNRLQRNKIGSNLRPKGTKRKKVNAVLVFVLAFCILSANIPGSTSSLGKYIFSRDLLTSNENAAQLKNTMFDSVTTDTRTSGSDDGIEGSINRIVETSTNLNRFKPGVPPIENFGSSLEKGQSGSSQIFSLQSDLVKQSTQLKVANSELLSRIAGLISERDKIWSFCLNGFSTSTFCNRVSNSKKFDAVIIGDSFALSWFPAVAKALPFDWNIQSLTLGQCEFARVDSLLDGKLFEECLAHRELVDKRILESKPELVIVSSSWGAVHRGDTSDWKTGLIAHLDFLRSTGAAVLYIGNVPGGQNWSDCLRKDSIAGCYGSAKRGSERRKIEIAEAQKRGFAVLDPTPLLCYKSICPGTITSIPVYWDGSHMSTDLSKELAPFIEYTLRLNYRFP